MRGRVSRCKFRPRPTVLLPRQLKRNFSSYFQFLHDRIRKFEVVGK